MNHINLIATTIGVTVGVVGAASIFIYHYMLNNQQHSTGSTSLDDAHKRIAELQAELEALRLQQSQQKKKRKISRRFVSNDSTYTVTDETDTDAFSTADTEIGDDEFYDCSDSESVIAENEIRISDESNHLDLILKEVDEAANGDFDIETYSKLQTLVNLHQDNVEVIWRFARACYYHAEATADKSIRRTILLEGIGHCERIIEIPNAELFKWYAILLGLNGDYLATADKIKNGDRFKNYIIKAIEIQPDDCELHYLLGRFKYEIANLSWFERKVASTLFSEIPSASHDEALACFDTAIRLGKRSLQIDLFISKCYIALKQYSRAVNSLKGILDQPVVAAGDEKVHAEASTLLNKYSGYIS
ncbi:regulator of microtubule dynamics protein 1-like [Hylaeus volcanicus]|uniref:regulator of microtubule dynamics protein 1-like n=1 Tax=Hylaeus volcanicus TaxID=313075 RepID=UPI0023B7E3CC|nr:regulator of microtubule dynamics protein 1-like [Hylaeus volcanicus]